MTRAEPRGFPRAATEPAFAHPSTNSQARRAFHEIPPTGFDRSRATLNNDWRARLPYGLIGVFLSGAPCETCFQEEAYHYLRVLAALNPRWRVILCDHASVARQTRIGRRGVECSYDPLIAVCRASGSCVSIGFQRRTGLSLPRWRYSNLFLDHLVLSNQSMFARTRNAAAVDTAVVPVPIRWPPRKPAPQVRRHMVLVGLATTKTDFATLLALRKWTDMRNGNQRGARQGAGGLSATHVSRSISARAGRPDTWPRGD